MSVRTVDAFSENGAVSKRTAKPNTENALRTNLRLRRRRSRAMSMSSMRIQSRRNDSACKRLEMEWMKSNLMQQSNAKRTREASRVCCAQNALRMKGSIVNGSRPALWSGYAANGAIKHSNQREISRSTVPDARSDISLIEPTEL